MSVADGLDVHRNAFKFAQGKFPSRIAHELPTLEREKLRGEAVAFIRRACFRAGATHYQLLNVPANANRAAIKESYHLLMALIHPDRAEASHEAWPVDCAQRANHAYAVLADDGARAQYDKALSVASAPRFARAPMQRRARRAPASGGRSAKKAALALGAIVAILLAAVSIDIFDEGLSFVAPSGRDIAGGPERPRFLGTSIVPARDHSLDMLPATSTPRSEKLLAPLWRDPVPPAQVAALPPPLRDAPARAPEERAPAEAPAPLPVVVAQAPVAAIAEAKLTSGQIEILVARLIGYYEAGEADKLMALLDPNEAGSRQGTRMRQAYLDFFRATRQRRLRVTNLDWQSASTTARAKGEARVEAEYVDARGALDRDIDVEMEIALRNGEARITRLSLYPNAP
jgi:DnaJ-domain-containing protein 1